MRSRIRFSGHLVPDSICDHLVPFLFILFRDHLVPDSKIMMSSFARRTRACRVHDAVARFRIETNHFRFCIGVCVKLDACL